ncbi:DUF3667 domain-containing protein [Sphingobacterium lactis]|uniref:DUF3667 domain-containing protein n=1 Tax=Sphingobacterium lactis TaxID=797291 RepID=A0A1H5Y7C8_9SPHI|nr:DUF3667 domain-containing protein [Sphingobacterium lactis]SEG19406.1 Protein of unknown function [Sphingobacterium lactis]
MSHGKLREDKTCLNCGHTVNEHFCPHCGQENTEPRQPFHYLFTHFFEDFTHYDGQFWKTMRYLLFSPGKLTKIYLSGKRQGYVPPVKLYIFISFVTFFLASFMSVNTGGDSSHGEHAVVDRNEKTINLQDSILNRALKDPDLTAEDSAFLIKTIGNKKGKQLADGLLGMTEDEGARAGTIYGTRNIAEYDSLVRAENSFIGKILRPYANKFFELKGHGKTTQEIAKGFITVFMHTFPKALFFYLPVFAFILWLFHNKKKWWYYEHGVFTLHYFSFLLIVAIFFILMNFLESSLSGQVWFNHLSTWIYTIALIYSAIYFFIAHHRFYATRKRSSLFIGLLVFLFNTFAFGITLLLLTGISILLIH